MSQAYTRLMPATLAPPRRKRVAAAIDGALSQTQNVAGRDHLLVITDASWGMYLDLDTKFQGTSTRLTYFHQGRDERLTDVYGNVVKEILA